MDLRFQEKRQTKDASYRLFRQGMVNNREDLAPHYDNGKKSIHKPDWKDPEALGAWLAGQDYAADNSRPSGQPS